jgi:hypothetical protein
MNSKYNDLINNKSNKMKKQNIKKTLKSTLAIADNDIEIEEEKKSEAELATEIFRAAIEH